VAQARARQVHPDIELDAALFEATWDFLDAAGFHQYEISNYGAFRSRMCTQFGHLGHVRMGRPRARRRPRNFAVRVMQTLPI